jgi:antitoxin (DNA-binding transcriptional repressor) of toxin-antitoxin stability system
MRLSLSEARKRLPELVKRVRGRRGTVVTITLLGEEAAELRAVEKREKTWNPAQALCDIIDRLPAVSGAGRDVSSHVKEHLYGA